MDYDVDLRLEKIDSRKKEVLDFYFLGQAFKEITQK